MLKQMTMGIATLGLVAALAGCGGADSKPAGATPAPAPAPAAGAKPAPGSSGGTVVDLKGTKFVPDKLEVKAGTTVKWVNQDNVDHSVFEGVPDSGKHLLQSDEFGNGQEFKYTFDKPGTYNIFCNSGAHHLIGMTMQIVVK